MNDRLKIPIDIYHPNDGLAEIKDETDTATSQTPPDAKVSIVGLHNNQIKLEIWYSPTPKIKSLGEVYLETHISIDNQSSELLPEELEYNSLNDISRKIGFAILKQGIIKKVEN